MARERQTIEEKASTVEEAVNSGLAKLGLPKEQVHIEILDEGRRGVLGIGGREAVVRLRVRTEPAPDQPQTDTRSGQQPVQPVDPEPETEKFEEPASTAVIEKTQAVEEGPDKDEPQESAVALEVLESLLEKMNVEASVDVGLSPPDDLTGRRIPILNITGEDLGILIGARGETLDAMQHLSRLMVGHRIRQRAYFVIDVEGYRQRREQALARMAERMGKKAIDRGTPVTLEPMPSYERRIIHMTLREDPQVRTESTGEGDRRRVRIYPL